jgi:5-methylcytosine-specific restriction enzyme subunit McrC
MSPNQTDAATAIALEQYGRSEESYSLSASQRSAIRGSELIQAVEIETGRYRLHAERFVGTALLPGLRIIVRPRFGAMGNVFFLLGYGDGLTKWGSQRFPYETEPDFFKAMAWLFEAEIAQALRFGVLRGYEERVELLPTLRGRPDLRLQLQEAPGRPYPLACRFVEFLDDTKFNRMLKAAIRRVRRLPGLSPELALRLRHHLSAFSNVADAAVVSAQALPDFNRLNEHWRGAAILARLILEQKTLVDRHGRTHGITFAVDMNNLFEAFIRKVVGRVARLNGLELAPEGHKPRFSDKARMKPDLILRRHGKTLAVADAKYKKIVPAGAKWSHANLYQLLAYCVGMKLDTGMLIYAESEGMPSVQVTKGIQKTLRTEEVSLRGTPGEIVANAERVGHLLVKQAREREEALATALPVSA